MVFKDIKITKKEVLTLSIIFISVLLIPTIIFSYWKKESFSNTGIIGDTFGGITAPFLSFLGSVLVYFALKSQIEANKIISDQFKEQNQDQLFFRLIDNLHVRINSYSILNPERIEIRSYETLKYIVEYNFRKMEDESIDYGRQLLAKSPDMISDKFYFDILKVQKEENFPTFEDASKLKEKLMNLESNDRWEHIKYYLGGRGYEKSQQRNVLRAIGSVYFYKTPFDDRQEMYSSVYYESINKFGGFLDGYFSVLEYLISNISTIKENKFYLDYLNNQFTKYERILIFYYMASGKSSPFFKTYVTQNEFLINLDQYSSDFIDLPSKKELDEELIQIVNWQQ